MAIGSNILDSENVRLLLLEPPAKQAGPISVQRMLQMAKGENSTSPLTIEFDGSVTALTEAQQKSLKDFASEFSSSDWRADVVAAPSLKAKSPILGRAVARGRARSVRRTLTGMSFRASTDYDPRSAPDTVTIKFVRYSGGGGA